MVAYSFTANRIGERFEIVVTRTVDGEAQAPDSPLLYSLEKIQNMPGLIQAAEDTSPREDMDLSADKQLWLDILAAAEAL